MDTNYKTIVLGATMVGMGYAHTHPGTLILEPGGLLAPEFTATFRPLRRDVHPSDGPLEESLRRNGVLSQDRLDMQALSVGMFRFAREQQSPILLLAEPVQVLEEEGYTVEILTNAGLRRVHAQRLLDTRPGKAARRTFNVLCHNPVPDFARRLSEQFPLGVEIVPGSREQEYVICFNATSRARISDVRRMIVDGWQAAFPQGEAHITAMAFDFDIQPVEDGRSLVGAAFDDPLAAFHAGADYQREGSGQYVQA